jgi:hypothetical protein
MKQFILLGFLFISLLSFGQKCGNTPEHNQEIVELAKKKIKKKVGTGECWDLAQYVLDETSSEWDHFEVYGRLINPKRECIYPGDIIQFEKVKLKWKDGKFTYTESMMHHTAVVMKVVNKNEVVIAHQNTAQTGKKVGESELFFDRITSGKYLIYRPTR